MGSRAPEGRERGRLNGPLPEEEDTLEEVESQDLLTVHSASYRNLSLLSISSDGSGSLFL